MSPALPCWPAAECDPSSEIGQQDRNGGGAVTSGLPVAASGLFLMLSQARSSAAELVEHFLLGVSLAAIPDLFIDGAGCFRVATLDAELEVLLISGEVGRVYHSESPCGFRQAAGVRFMESQFDPIAARNRAADTRKSVLSAVCLA
jgi:hypothetical protein